MALSRRESAINFKLTATRLRPERVEEVRPTPPPPDHSITAAAVAAAAAADRFFPLFPFERDGYYSNAIRKYCI